MKRQQLSQLTIHAIAIQVPILIKLVPIESKSDMSKLISNLEGIHTSQEAPPQLGAL